MFAMNAMVECHALQLKMARPDAYDCPTRQPEDLNGTQGLDGRGERIRTFDPLLPKQNGKRASMRLWQVNPYLLAVDLAPLQSGLRRTR